MSTERAIATRDGEVLLSASEVELVKRTIAKGATDEELKLFLFDCRRQGVHPLDKLIHFSLRTNQKTGQRTYTPITSIDYMRMRAAETGELAGSDDPVYAFKEGETVIPQSATVTVYRMTQGQRFPYTATARWAEYYPGDRDGFMWKKMPLLMLGKCAEALVLRKAFPKQLHGIYERAEMAQAGSEDTPGLADGHSGHVERRPTRGTLTSEALSSDAVPPGTSVKWREPRGLESVKAPVLEEEAAEAEPSVESLFPDPQIDVERERLLNECRALRNQIGVMKKTKKDQDAWAQEQREAWVTYCGDVTPSQADPAALTDLKKWLETRAGT